MIIFNFFSSYGTSLVIRITQTLPLLYYPVRIMSSRSRKHTVQDSSDDERNSSRSPSRSPSPPKEKKKSSVKREDPPKETKEKTKTKTVPKKSEPVKEKSEPVKKDTKRTWADIQDEEETTTEGKTVPFKKRSEKVVKKHSEKMMSPLGGMKPVLRPILQRPPTKKGTEVFNICCSLDKNSVGTHVQLWKEDGKWHSIISRVKSTRDEGEGEAKHFTQSEVSSTLHTLNTQDLSIVSTYLHSVTSASLRLVVQMYSSSGDMLLSEEIRTRMMDMETKYNNLLKLFTVLE